MPPLKPANPGQCRAHTAALARTSGDAGSRKFHTSATAPPGRRIRRHSRRNACGSIQWKAWAAHTRSTEASASPVRSADPAVEENPARSPRRASATALIWSFGSTASTMQPSSSSCSENLPVPDPTSATRVPAANPSSEARCAISAGA